jgi:hypothetical protein
MSTLYVGWRTKFINNMRVRWWSVNFGDCKTGSRAECGEGQAKGWHAKGVFSQLLV